MHHGIVRVFFQHDAKVNDGFRETFFVDAPTGTLFDETRADPHIFHLAFEGVQQSDLLLILIGAQGVIISTFPITQTHVSLGESGRNRPVIRG